MAIHRNLMLARLVAAAGASLVLLGAQASSESVRKAKPAPVQPVAAPVALGDEELLLSTRVSVGNIPCELGQSVNLRPNADAPGYFHLQLKNQRFHLRPVMSATGALRLEDQTRGAVWIQLANKSMLMNQKIGQRMADGCMSQSQLVVAQAMKDAPPPDLLGPPAAEPEPATRP